MTSSLRIVIRRLFHASRRGWPARLPHLAPFLALAAMLAGLGTPAGAQSPAVTLVVCAPGYPGSTEEARPAMDALAAAVAAAAGWKAGDLKAVYFENEQRGLERLAGADAAVTLVPLSFWLQHQAALRLEPFMQAIEEGGKAAESWTLVAGAGAVSRPAELSGFELVSLAGYAPGFIRGPALGAWGDLPQDVTITFSNAVLTGLRRASTGAKVALLLDRAQAAALPTLPFAKKLQVVTTSPALPVSVLASVGNRLSAPRQKALSNALASLQKTAAGREALAGVRLTGFITADQAALARARDAFARARE